LIAKEILAQTQPGFVILLLEPDVTIFNILNSLGPLHKTNIITVMHKAAAKANKQGLIYNPERTPSHRLRQMLPTNKVVGAVVFDHKHSGNPIIASAACIRMLDSLISVPSTKP
jgi:hypothetical protein